MLGFGHISATQAVNISTKLVDSSSAGEQALETKRVDTCSFSNDLVKAFLDRKVAFKTTTPARLQLDFTRRAFELVLPVAR